MLKENLYWIKCRVKNVYRRYLTVENPDTYILSDKSFIKKIYRKRTGKKINLHRPRTFFEKENWLKLYDRKPQYTMMVDKYEAKEYVGDIIGENYIVPLLGVWKNASDIDFEHLPNKFVLKCTHNSDVIICNDKASLDIGAVREKLNQQLKEDYYLKKREWPYKNVTRQIICEQYMENSNGDSPIEYKVFCFNGTPKLFMVISNRFNSGGLMSDVYDCEWNYLEFIDNGDPCAGDIFEKPRCFDELYKLCELLSKDIPFVRVDFNYWNEHLYFGELTFFHSAGLGSFLPESWEYTIGDWIELPRKRRDLF